MRYNKFGFEEVNLMRLK